MALSNVSKNSNLCVWHMYVNLWSCDAGIASQDQSSALMIAALSLRYRVEGTRHVQVRVTCACNSATESPHLYKCIDVKKVPAIVCGVFSYTMRSRLDCKGVIFSIPCLGGCDVPNEGWDLELIKYATKLDWAYSLVTNTHTHASSLAKRVYM